MKLVPPLLAFLGLTACGYRAIYAGERPALALSVDSAVHRVAEPAAVDAVLDGVRDELSRNGVLATGNTYPQLVVEVLRIDEDPRGMLAVTAEGEPAVSSRGAAIAVTARGWVIEERGARPTRDSGDIRRIMTFAHSDGPGLDSVGRSGAVRSAAYATGEALARRVLGEPEPGFEPF